MESEKNRDQNRNETWEVRVLCPQIVFVLADFDKYFFVVKNLLKFAPTILLIWKFSVNGLF